MYRELIVKPVVLQRVNLDTVLIFFQVLFFQIYFNINVINVGEFGSVIFLLSFFFFVSLLLNFRFIYSKHFVYKIRFHFLIFIALIAWVSIRVTVDLNDLEYLKQITVATTGGMLLFYFVGTFLGVSFQRLLYFNGGKDLNSIFLILFLCLNIWMIYNFSMRLSSSYFYLEGVKGAYQRAGNFLSIMYIVASFIYFQRICDFQRKKKVVNAYFFFCVYSLSSLIALIASQLFGSNSATAIIAGVYMMTLVMAMIVSNERLLSKYIKEGVRFPFSKIFLRLLLVYSFYIVVFLSILLTGIILFSGFDVSGLRVFGFGSGVNDSLQSRFEILYHQGALQMGYSPWFGNMNVAYLVTEDSGKTLHSFLPYVLANLGLVGLILVLLLFFVVFFQFYRNIKLYKTLDKVSGFSLNLKSFYSFFILFYLFSFANLATGITWPVLWFSLAFFSLPIDVKCEALK